MIHNVCLWWIIIDTQCMFMGDNYCTRCIFMRDNYLYTIYVSFSQWQGPWLLQSHMYQGDAWWPTPTLYNMKGLENLEDKKQIMSLYLPVWKSIQRVFRTGWVVYTEQSVIRLQRDPGIDQAHLTVNSQGELLLDIWYKSCYGGTCWKALVSHLFVKCW